MLHEEIVPKLNDIHKDIIEFVAAESSGVAESFISTMKAIMKVGYFYY